MRYNMSGVPAAIESYSLFSSSSDNLSAENTKPIRLTIESVIKDIDKNTIARTVQDGFSEIAITTGGKLYEY